MTALTRAQIKDRASTEATILAGKWLCTIGNGSVRVMPPFRDGEDPSHRLTIRTRPINPLKDRAEDIPESVKQILGQPAIELRLDSADQFAYAADLLLSFLSETAQDNFEDAVTGAEMDNGAFVLNDDQVKAYFERLLNAAEGKQGHVTYRKNPKAQNPAYAWVAYDLKPVPAEKPAERD